MVSVSGNAAVVTHLIVQGTAIYSSVQINVQCRARIAIAQWDAEVSMVERNACGLAEVVLESPLTP